MSFAKPIEAAFEEYLKDDRARFIGLMTIPLLVIYNSFVILEYFIFYRTFILTFIIHFGLVTPIIIYSSIIIKRKPSRFVREFANAVPFIFILVNIMLIYRLNMSPFTDNYVYLALLCAVHMNVNRRLSFKTAILASAVYLMIYSIGLLSGDGSPFAKGMALSMMGFTLLMTVGASWRMERDERYGVVRTLRDTIILKATEAAAFHDALTGLPNRRLFEQTAAKLWQESPATAMVAVLMIDVDNFKAFNDRYGHPAGDSCLKRVGVAISSTLRDHDDLLVRFGGEEFIVLLPNTDLQAAIHVAERIRLAIEHLGITHEAIGQSHVVTASLGVTAAPVSEQTVTNLTALADNALYKAKSNGRNQVWPRQAQVVTQFSAPIADQRTRSELSCMDMASRG